jgi:hypothetical protein
LLNAFWAAHSLCLYIPLASHFSGFDLVLFRARNLKKYGNSSTITALLKTPSAKNNVAQTGKMKR